MKIGIPKETRPGEARVAATPETITKLNKLGFEVVVEAGAGALAQFPDDAYTKAGATVVDGAEVWGADIIVKINPPHLPAKKRKHEAKLMREGQVLISLMQPAQNTELVNLLGEQKISALAMDCIPRISRAQKMDVLSSMANIAGYRAVIEAANQFGRFFGGQMTAAGKSPPAQVLVIGAGVAGLAAIATANAMGARVKAFDVRPSCKEQVQSLGGEFLWVDMDESGEGSGGYAKEMSKEFIEAEMRLFAEQAKEVDIIITTALIPGKKAPTLITKEMVASMKPGSVVVDLAAEQGGNCEGTVAGEVAEVDGVRIIGFTDLTSRLPTHASQFYGNNVVNLLKDMGGAEDFKIDEEDVVVRGALVLRDGEVKWPPPKIEIPTPPPVKETVPVPKVSDELEKARQGSKWVMPATAVGAVAVFGVLGMYAPPEFLRHFTVFVLAIVVGYQVIWNVSPALHTPLMSVTNAISGIIIVGGLLQVGAGGLASVLGAIAILVATINIAGGFLVTQRMLAMFQKG